MLIKIPHHIEMRYSLFYDFCPFTYILRIYVSYWSHLIYYAKSYGKKNKLNLISTKSVSKLSLYIRSSLSYLLTIVSISIGNSKKNRILGNIFGYLRQNMSVYSQIPNFLAFLGIKKKRAVCPLPADRYLCEDRISVYIISFYVLIILQF